MKKIIFLSIITCCLCFTSNSVAQVTIAPTNLYIDSGTTFGTYMVINGSSQNQEIAIDFYFGYSQSDEKGNKRSVSDDTVRAQQYSIADHIKAFPQNFVLNPGQRQVVRLRVNAPNDLPDGTYWARIRTASTPESPPVELSSTEAVSARVGITIEQVTGLFYKKGDVSTGIEIEDLRTQLTDGNLTIFTDLNRTGNSPFLGSITYSILDKNNETVREGFTSTSVYFDGTHHREFNIEDLSAGEYTVRVHFETRRSDISQNDLVQMEPVTETTSIRIP